MSFFFIPFKLFYILWLSFFASQKTQYKIEARGPFSNIISSIDKIIEQKGVPSSWLDLIECLNKPGDFSLSDNIDELSIEIIDLMTAFASGKISFREMGQRFGVKALVIFEMARDLSVKIKLLGRIPKRWVT